MLNEHVRGVNQSIHLFKPTRKTPSTGEEDEAGLILSPNENVTQRHNILLYPHICLLSLRVAEYKQLMQQR
jgi:hypothetical protein